MSLEQMESKFSKYEIARILGARALQLAMDAPVLIKIEDEILEEINYDVLKIAEIEFESEVLPITVKRPFPEKVDEKIKKVSKKEMDEMKKEGEVAKMQEVKREEAEDRKIAEKEAEEEREIAEEGEIMALAMPEDEIEKEEDAEEGI